MPGTMAQILSDKVKSLRDLSTESIRDWSSDVSNHRDAHVQGNAGLTITSAVRNDIAQACRLRGFKMTADHARPTTAEHHRARHLSKHRAQRAPHDEPVPNALNIKFGQEYRVEKSYSDLFRPHQGTRSPSQHFHHEKRTQEALADQSGKQQHEEQVLEREGQQRIVGRGGASCLCLGWVWARLGGRVLALGRGPGCVRGRVLDLGCGPGCGRARGSRAAGLSRVLSVVALAAVSRVASALASISWPWVAVRAVAGSADVRETALAASASAASWVEGVVARGSEGGDGCLRLEGG